jgi:hypothetical protein
VEGVATGGMRIAHFFNQKWKVKVFQKLLYTFRFFEYAKQKSS